MIINKRRHNSYVYTEVTGRTIHTGGPFPRIRLHLGTHPGQEICILWFYSVPKSIK